MGVLDFLSAEAGQKRTQALNDTLGDIGGFLGQFLSPRGRETAQGVIQAIDMVNPVSGMQQAGQDFSQGNYVGAMTEVAGVLIPTAIVAKYGSKTALAAAQNLSETLAVTAGGMREVGESAYEAVINRMNQPGPVPTMGSMGANIGHNQGPSMQPDEIIPDARPTFVPQYSASFEAAQKIPQNRGTYEQMRKMLIDRGAKEDELEWSGFDNKFRDQEKITKQGILDYLERTTRVDPDAGPQIGDFSGGILSPMVSRETNQVDGLMTDGEVVTEAELTQRYLDLNLEDETFYYMNDYRQEMLNSGDHFQAKDMSDEDLMVVAKEQGYSTADSVSGEMVVTPDDLIEFKQNLIEEFNGADTWMSPSSFSLAGDRDYTIHESEDAALDYIMEFDDAEALARESLIDNAQNYDVVELRDMLGMGGEADVGESGVQYSEYFTPGSTNYAENRYIYEAPISGSRNYTTQFNDAHHNESDIMVHTRTATFPLANDAGKAHHVGEVQSDWAQQLRAGKARFAEEVDESGNPKSYDSLTFDETKAITQGISGEHVLEAMQRPAINHYNEYVNLDNPDTPHLGLAADVYEWLEGSKVMKTFDPNDSATFGFMPSAAMVLEYFMDPKIQTKAAKDFRAKPYNQLETNQFKDQLTAEHTGDDMQKAYSKHKKAVKEGEAVAYSGGHLANARGVSRRLKEGGPLINSTNKWVDFALRREITDAVATGNEWMTISNPQMVKSMTMGDAHGQGEFYGKIVPQRLQKLIRTFDKKAKVEPVEIMTGDGPTQVLGIQLTDDLVKKIANKGMPIFSVGAGGAGVLGVLSQQQQSQQQSQQQPQGILGAM